MSGVLLRQTSAAARSSSSRCFSTSFVRQDLVKDAYINALKSYKPVPVPKDAHVGNVKAYTMPPIPKPPVVPSDLASELSSYDAQEPTKATVAPVSTESVSESDGGAEAFLEMLGAPEPEEKHH